MPTGHNKAQAQQVFTFPKTSIPDGATPVPVTLLPASVASLTMSVARCTDADPTIWPDPTTTLEVDLQASTDGGQTWQDLGGFTSAGGIGTMKDGTQRQFTTCTWNFQGVPTHVRGSINVANGPLVTSVSISVG